MLSDSCARSRWQPPSDEDSPSPLSLAGSPSITSYTDLRQAKVAGEKKSLTQIISYQQVLFVWQFIREQTATFNMHSPWKVLCFSNVFMCIIKDTETFISKAMSLYHLFS